MSGDVVGGKGERLVGLMVSVMLSKRFRQLLHSRSLTVSPCVSHDQILFKRIGHSSSLESLEKVQSGSGLNISNE